MHPKTLKPKSYFQDSTIPTYGLSKILQVSCHRCNKAIKIASKSVRSFSVRENWALYELEWQRIKATDCIIKVAILRGNTMWHSFALRDWAYKQISAWQPLLPSAKGLSFTLCIYFYAKSKSFPSILFFIFSFGKHHVVRKDLGTYFQLNMGSMSYYCWHHPWSEYVGRQNNKPLSFYVPSWNVLLTCMWWVLAIIEDYMMVEYVELLLRLCWISWITIAWWLRT